MPQRDNKQERVTEKTINIIENIPEHSPVLIHLARDWTLCPKDDVTLCPKEDGTLYPKEDVTLRPKEDGTLCPKG